MNQTPLFDRTSASEWHFHLGISPISDNRASILARVHLYMSKPKQVTPTVCAKGWRQNKPTISHIMHTERRSGLLIVSILLSKCVLHGEYLGSMTLCCTAIQTHFRYRMVSGWFSRSLATPIPRQHAHCDFGHFGPKMVCER